jgi:hypothetical protein
MVDPKTISLVYSVLNTNNTYCVTMDEWKKWVDLSKNVLPSFSFPVALYFLYNLCKLWKNVSFSFSFPIPLFYVSNLRENGPKLSKFLSKCLIFSKLCIAFLFLAFVSLNYGELQYDLMTFS